MTIEEKILNLKKNFESKGLTLSLAESCTGGLLAAEIVKHPGVSSFFAGAVVSYATHVKEDLLDVPVHLLKTMGEVSGPVAIAMAQGAKQNMSSDWALSITGVAGPGGESKDKPVGTVCFAVVGPGFEQSIKKEFKIKNRNEIQQASIEFAIDFVLESLKL